MGSSIGIASGPVSPVPAQRTPPVSAWRAWIPLVDLWILPPFPFDNGGVEKKKEKEEEKEEEKKGNHLYLEMTPPPMSPPEPSPTTWPPIPSLYVSVGCFMFFSK